MKLIDANLLLYVVNRDSVHHNPLHSWWENALDGDEPIALCWAVLLSFLRISTNTRVFATPLTPEQATAIVAAWLSQEMVQLVSETESHWTILSDLIEQLGTAGNLTTDAHLAAIAISRGASLVSCDTDFSRFPNLKWENPLA